MEAAMGETQPWGPKEHPVAINSRQLKNP